jgi:hypothetical protein
MPTTYEPIATTTLSSSATTITLSSIPSGYTDLRMVAFIKLVGGPSGGVANEYFTFNGDTASNYSDTNMRGDGSSPVSYRLSNGTYIQLGLLPSSGGGTAAGTFGTGIFHIQNYSNLKVFKTVLSRTNSTSSVVEASAGLWRSTAIITSITYFGDGNILANSTFTIYGIKAAAPAPKATGGDLVYTDNTYWYHVFKNSGIFDVRQALTADYLVVAGGGSGGREDYQTGLGGGGGAGGLRSTVSPTGGGGSAESTLSLTTQPYIVTVGAGGASRTTGFVGNNGSNSTFSTITSTGGGGGAGGNTTTTLAGQAGGSGGGGQGTSPYNTGGAASPSGQGYPGGNSIGGQGGGSGGGGGAGEAGNTNGGAQGGDGVANSISGASVTYAGGGGGAGYAAAALGGAGGGGTGSYYTSTAATNGTLNTGGGGGGGANNNPAPDTRRSGAGGSGIVIVRYAV